MNMTKNTLLALVAMASASASFAQNVTQAAPVGVLGQSFSEAYAGLSDIRNYSKNQYGVGLAANVPVTSYLDLGAGYEYGWVRGESHYNSVNARAIAYTAISGVKPFAGAILGYDWDQSSVGKDDRSTWALTAGVEIPVGPVAITPRVIYSDDFRSSNRSYQQLTTEVEANYWITTTTAVFATVGRTDVNQSDARAWNYTVGARFKF